MCHIVVYGIQYPSASLIVNATERVTGRKSRVLQTEEIGCRCQTFLSLCLRSSISSCVSPLVFALWASLTSIVWVSIETRFGPLLGQFEPQFGFFPRPRQPFLGVLWLSVCSVWSPEYGGKVGGQEGAEGLYPNLHPEDTSLTCLSERRRATHTLLLPVSLVFNRTDLIVKQRYN